MLRGQYDKPGEKVEPGVPAVLPPIKRDDPAARLTRLDLAHWLVVAGEPAHGPRRRQPALAAVVRHGPGEDELRLRHPGRAAEPPGAARLAGGRVPRQRLGRQAAGASSSSCRRRFAGVRRVTPRACWPRTRRIGCYARGPRFRLDAEQIRDNALFVSGLDQPARWAAAA